MTIVMWEIGTEQTLVALEAIIERGRKTFIEVGKALNEIHERRLYRELGFDTFEDYCRDRWGWSRQQSYRLIDAAHVVAVLSPIGDKLPASESQARELVPLFRQDEAAIVEVWRDLCERHGDDITAEKVREAVEEKLSSNTPSPKKSPHVSRNNGNNEWYTPIEYVAAAHRVMGAIDLDPASTAIANRTVRASTYFTVEQDGLRQPWAGRVFMNPPYASDLVGKFISKLVEHFVAGDVTEAIVLVNNATETNWFQLILSHASAVCFPRQRIRFLDPCGNPGAPLQGQAILYLGGKATLFAEFNDFGKVLFG